MKIYTKTGDQGLTSLMSPSRIPKSDDRFEALGSIDELTSAIGLAKAMITCDTLKGKLERIQNDLITVMAGIASPGNRDYVLDLAEVTFLEEEIDDMDASFTRPCQFILPGKCELSARLDVARTVARRAERAVVATDRKYGVHEHTRMYLNRLADYLYILARLMDDYADNGKLFEVTGKGSTTPVKAVPTESGSAPAFNERGFLTLEGASFLIHEIEKHAKEVGKKAVIAICNAEGNPVAVHVMDDAFLVSYEVAVKKAYTAVSVKMSTMELSHLVQPGETFYGLQNLSQMVVFGGGVPLKVGEKIVGGLGISGGTGEEDHALCEYGLEVFKNLLA